VALEDGGFPGVLEARGDGERCHCIQRRHRADRSTRRGAFAWSSHSDLCTERSMSCCGTTKRRSGRRSSSFREPGRSPILRQTRRLAGLRGITGEEDEMDESFFREQRFQIRSHASPRTGRRRQGSFSLRALSWSPKCAETANDTDRMPWLRYSLAAVCCRGRMVGVHLTRALLRFARIQCHLSHADLCERREAAKAGCRLKARPTIQPQICHRNMRASIKARNTARNGCATYRNCTMPLRTAYSTMSRCCASPSCP